MTRTPSVSPEAVAEHGLTAAEFDKIVEILGRTPNLLELGIFSVMWSEHCSYKSSRRWLRLLPTDGPQVICGPGENAGVVDIGDGMAAVFKIESHNHPSFIEPRQGAATGVGGILRDVFTMGARPVAILDSLRFGALDHPRTRHLVHGVTAGIGGYGNCMGVPTVGGETTFDPGYDGNILVNAMCVGLAPAERVFYARAAGIGNPLVYLGARTGRDGIHGATMASAEFSEGGEDKRPTVQVGDPFMEKLLLEACLELMQTDLVVAIQDMGAAGLTSSSFEMAARGGVGVEMDLDLVPVRETGMTPYEIMLSESQERMLLVLEEGAEADAFRVFEKWGLDYATVGRITGSGLMVLRWHGDEVARVPIQPVSGASPILERPWTATLSPVPLVPFDVAPTMAPMAALMRLIGSPDLCSKRWITTQYDQTVMGDTVAGPGGDAAIVRVHGTRRGLALTTDCTPRYCAAAPRLGGRQAVAEAWRNLTAVGARPLAVTDCLNFGSPERPRIMGQFKGCLEGMAEACRVLDFPVVSGNVSFYNETDGRGIPPTPVVGGLGLIDDLERRAGLLYAAGMRLVLIGETFGWLGCSLYLREALGRKEGAPPPVDLELERRNGDFVRAEIRAGRVRACHDLSDGGLLVALAEMALASGTGADLEIPGDCLTPEGWLFGEDQGRYLVAVDGEALDGLMLAARNAGVLARPVGRTGGLTLTLNGADAICLDELASLHDATLPAAMDLG